MGCYSPSSQIRIRMLTFGEDGEIEPDLILYRLQKALRTRISMNIQEKSNAYRVVNSECDGLPGLIIDQYGDYVVCQFLTAGAEFFRQEIIEAIKKTLSPRGIWERSDARVREKEGLEKRCGPLYGDVPERVKIQEQGLYFWVDIKQGHKTGFYLDQRENRSIVRAFSRGKKVLNCFSYTGAFGIYSLKGGAREVINVDISPKALELLQANLKLNGLEGAPSYPLKKNVFHLLRELYAREENFDIIILDPPKFVSGKKNIQGGIRGYKELNYSAMRILRPGGLLFTFSCSGLIEEELFKSIVYSSALDAGKEVLVLKSLSQAMDHFYPMTFPEGKYLKGLMLRVI